MMGTIDCCYQTPCGWCSKWDKKCDRKIGELCNGSNVPEQKGVPKMPKTVNPNYIPPASVKIRYEDEMSDREILNYIKSGKGLPPFRTKE